eukprot:COSAG06_NODE_3404_length_5394_cov_6.648914_5_plen_86_part_00
MVDSNGVETLRNAPQERADQPRNAKKNVLLLSFPICLSRACLGKMMEFYKNKTAQKVRFPYRRIHRRRHRPFPFATNARECTQRA